MDTTNSELLPFTSQVFGCSCVCVLPRINAAGYAEKQRQNTISLLSLPCRWVLVKDHLPSARNGNSTASASQKIPWFLWEQEEWFGWDREDAVLSGAECPHLGRWCHVLQGALWRKELPHVVIQVFILSLSLGLSRCGGCQAGSPLVAQLSWVLQEMWFRGVMGGALRGSDLQCTVEKPMRRDGFSFPCLYLKDVSDPGSSVLCQQKVLTDPWTQEQLFTEGLCVDTCITSSKVCLWESPEILVTLCNGWWREGKVLEENYFVPPHQLWFFP